MALILLTVISMACSVSAQELKCHTEINISKIQNTNRELFSNLETTINQYLNNTQFGEQHFSPEERIECQFVLTVEEYANDFLRGEMLIQSRRPVFNSNYITPLLNFKDKRISFSFREGDELSYNSEVSTNDLTALLDFYANIIVGLDADSFSPHGGSEYYKRANLIVNRAQSKGEAGWAAYGDERNRSSLINVFSEETGYGFRDILYDYHRKGLDVMSMNPSRGRAEISSCIYHLNDVLEKKQSSLAGILFKDSKLEELKSIFSEGRTDERQKIAEILNRHFPTVDLN